jgi:SAM-dependent methyltransferase
MTDGLSAEDDITGKDTLHSFSRTYRFNEWMFAQIYPWVKGKVIEAGSGIGNISKLFIERGNTIVLSDIRADYQLRLKRSFGNNEFCGGVVHLDLSIPDLENEHPSLIGQFETVVALNVVEHIDADHQAIINCKKLLKKGGRLIVLVPAFSFLYNSFDKDLQHFRRYTRKTLGELFRQNGLKVLHTQYFNFAGMIGWFISGNLLGYKKIPRSQLRIFERLVPLFRLIDRVLFRIAGVSVIAIGEKTG